MDTLSTILKTLHLQGSVYFNSCFCSPWGLEIQQDSRASFHIVVRGQCWLQMEDLAEPMPLVGGDILVLPRGSRHQIVDRPDRRCLDGEYVVEQIMAGASPFAGDNSNFNIICGYFEFDQEFNHPFVQSLPKIIHLRQQDRQHFDWLDSALHLIAAETNQHQPGTDVLIDRFTEVLFIQIIRAYINMKKHDGGDEDYLCALNDEYISQSLALMHSQPEKNWSVESLAKAIGMSRSPFSNRFHTLVGIPPMRYLLNWRMQLAKQKIEQSRQSLADIAEQVGYSSDSAFKKAFKRFFKSTPTSFRKKSE